MQRVVVIKPPYGTTIRSLHNSTDLWLMYDSSQEEIIVEFLRDLSWGHEEKLRQEAAAAANAPPVIQVNVAQATLQAVKAMPTVSSIPTPGQHDWGGPYKLGSTCSKCGVKADGLEKTCKPPQT